MKRVITLFAVLLMGWSVNAWSFACKTANGTAIPIGGGSANVYVNLAPAVNVGQNLVVDLSTQIFCHNDYPETITDYVTLQRGSAYGGVLSNFSGTVKYSGSSYPFPTTSETPRVVYNSRTDKPWPVALYLTPVSSAGGVAIKAGSLIAVLILRQTNNYNSDDFQFVWNIYANNDVVVPTGGCDVSARDVTVTLRTTLVQCRFLLPFIVRKAKTWGITSPAQPQMRATRFSPIPRRFHQRRASAYS